jgi:hypothetical protein
MGACWSCTDVDPQAAPRLSLRRHEAGVPDCPICPVAAARERYGVAAALVLARFRLLASTPAISTSPRTA